jgi:molecular chaperone HscB
MDSSVIDYYALLGIEEQFHLDVKALRQAYLSRARTAHPDHHATTAADTSVSAASETTTDATTASASLNAAYQTLLDPHQRLAYLLARYGLVDPDGKSNAVLPQAFLMEMMALNDAIAELPHTQAADQIAETLRAYQQAIADRLASVMTAFDAATQDQRAPVIGPALGLYHEQRYILRLWAALRTFAA